MINRYRYKAFDQAGDLRDLYDTADGDLEVVRDVFCDFLY